VRNKRNFVAVVVMLLAIAALLTLQWAKRTHADDSPKEVKPYLVGETPGATKIYKLVHQGCEIFIAENFPIQFQPTAVSVSITTGRGCK
jgi:hypothetical protein